MFEVSNQNKNINKSSTKIMKTKGNQTLHFLEYPHIILKPQKTQIEKVLICLHYTVQT